ncbi:RNA 2',3'-cyclic phosphodiesterase [Candidatus Woesearchaeota archaeon]|nr:MAG: RNA 2',3'-cyclic phosphodiesterase [Candidatus Woesearchaeota archaeon]
MRLFIAIDLPEHVKDYLELVKREFSRYFLAKWVRRENIHLTVKFLGEVKDELVDELINRLNRIKIKPFKLCIDSLGVFPSERFARVLWAGFDASSELIDLRRQIDSELPFGDEKEFKAHATIARIKKIKDKKGFVEKLRKFEIERLCFEVKCFVLYKSTLTPEGPIYEVVKEFALS